MNNTTLTNMTFEPGDISTYGHSYRVYYTICMAILMPVIIFGNSLVLVAIATEKKLQTIPNMFVRSLAIGDLFVGLVVIPLYLASFWDVGLDHKDMMSCMTKFSAVVMSCGASLLSLMFVALDRYIAIVFPYRYINSVTKERALTLIISIWVYVTLVSFLPLFGWNKWDNNKQCEFYTVMEKSYIILSVFLTITVTLTLTTYMYIHIFTQVYKQQLKMKKSQSNRTLDSLHTNQSNDNANTTQISVDREKAAARVMAVVYFLFVCFWLPYLSVSPLRYVIEDKGLVIILKNFTLILAMSNSAINPIVYAWMRMTFRRQFLKILHIKRYEIYPTSE